MKGEKKKELNLDPGHGIIPEGPGCLGAGRGIDLNQTEKKRARKWSALRHGRHQETGDLRIILMSVCPTAVRDHFN